MFFEDGGIAFHSAIPIGVITACNAALGRLLDRAPQELPGGTFFDVTHPEDLEEVRANCSLMHAGAARIIRHENDVVPGLVADAPPSPQRRVDHRGVRSRRLARH